MSTTATAKRPKTRLPSPVSVPSAALVATGLIGGYGIARATGVRPLGGVALLACGVAAGRTWLASAGPVTTAGLGTLYVAGFGLSHPLAKKLGAWPSVLTVTAVNAAASWALVDRHNFADTV
ncbi:hypothetical protein [Kocuria tytonis]|uniref:Uncharacterized protein n=1 Tax=Kocuria tytonis TaxID=2054280 RepID=A0A495AB03_9MICC|nr:hypothetical protein [Kocuria tytonis]RKQ36963.1 hypothetical protein C1C97_005015 [Kocuria tytonis]